MAAVRWIVVFGLLGLSGCSCGSSGSGGDEVDGGGDCAGQTCVDGEVCRYNNCVPDPAPCSTNDDCAGDFYCDTSADECLPWGVGPGGVSDDMCTREVVAGVFFPDVQCEWLGPPAGDPYPNHKNVLGAPMVADFGVSGDPELPRPFIVFISYNCTDGGDESCQGIDPNCTGVVRVIDGRTCDQIANIDTPLPIAATSVALGDLTGNNVPEIVAAGVGGGLIAWEYDGAATFSLLWRSADTFGVGTCNWAGPSIHDLDDDGVPEIMLYGGVYDAAGVLLDSTLGPLNADIGTGYIPVVADADADGAPELITGLGTYGWDAVNTQWVLETTLGATTAHTSVADLGTFGANAANDDRATLDGVAEVVTVEGGIVTAYELGGRVLFSEPIPGGGIGGAPTIADFDGDGRVEFASAGLASYAVFDPDCTGTPDSLTCPSMRTDGLLWTQPSQDASSNRTGSSVFDFEGDGIAEVVYGDECFTRVYEGATGDVLYSRFRTSCTWYENPIIADTDADFGAEIVITSNDNCAVVCPGVDPIFDGVRCFDESDCPGATSCLREADSDPVGFCRCQNDADCGGDGFTCLDPIAGPSAMGKVCRAAHPGGSTAFGVRVIGDKLGRWVPTRTIWNQHAYAVTNVDERGSVPQSSSWSRNWDDPQLNNFRQNAPGFGAGAGLMPDLTGRQSKFSCPASGTATLTIEVCNRGTEPVADGVPVAMYDGSDVVCTAATAARLDPGVCEAVTCTWDAAPADPVDITAIVDDDGLGGGLHFECREQNNELIVEDVACP